MSKNNLTEKNLRLWGQILSNTTPEGLLYMAMRHAGYSLSDMLGRPITIKRLWVTRIPLDQFGLDAGDPETETVGIYLVIGDDLPGQAILTLSLDDAMYMTDWLLEARPGTTTRLGPLERSALAETGNLTLSSFLNAVAEFSGDPLRLSPPALMVDMLAAILEEVATSTVTISDELLVIGTDFRDVDDSIAMRFWVLPDPAVLSLYSSVPSSKKGRG